MISALTSAFSRRTAWYAMTGFWMNQKIGTSSSGYPAGYSVEWPKFAAGPPPSTCAAIR